MTSDDRTRHGRPVNPIGAAIRRLRRKTRPWRRHFQRRPDSATIQRTVPLRPDDASDRRRRWHVLVDLIHDHCPQQDVSVVDIGTYQGHSCAHIHRYCPHVSNIYAVDLRRPDPERDLLSGLSRVTFFQGDSCESAKRFPDASIDLIFVDADHAEPAVRRDLESWVPKVKPGGVIAGHDYASRRHPGVKRAVDAFFALYPNTIQVESDMVWWTLKAHSDAD